MVMKMTSFFPQVIVFESRSLSSGEHVGVVVNKEYCFGINEIQLSKKIHETKEIQTKISNERKWFERTRIRRIPLNLSRVPQITRTQFQSMHCTKNEVFH